MAKHFLSTPPKTIDWTALCLRLGLGFFMAFSHGWPKLQQLLAGGEIQFPALFGLPSSISLGLAVFAEFFCALLVMLGWRTRWACLPLVVTMLVAGLVIHWGDPLFHTRTGGSKEFAFLYLLGFVAIALLGSGRYSVDYALGKKA